MGKVALEDSPRPFKDGVMTPFFWVMTPFLQGHGDSKYGHSRYDDYGYLSCSKPTF